jgi:endoglucanase
MQFFKRLGLVLGLLAAGAAFAQEAPPDLVGINVAGAGFGPKVLPGKHGTNYFFPPDGYFDRWAERGIKTIRFSFKWERLQPKAMGEFDTEYAARIDKALDQAGAAGIHVMLDIHNYGRYYNEIVGRDVPMDVYRDLMERIASRWGSHPSLFAYDIMNEPYGDANDYWFELAQTGIDAVRKHDKKSTLYIEGRRWSSSYNWPKYNDDLLDLKDPSDNIVYSAHMYVDKHNAGLYKEKIGEKGFSPDPMVGVNRLKPFVEWLQKHGKRGHIGEFGVPGDDERWLVIMDNALAYLQENCIPMTYWAAGSHWGPNYPLSVEPLKGKDRPQWSVLKKYLGTGNCTAIGPAK